MTPNKEDTTHKGWLDEDAAGIRSLAQGRAEHHRRASAITNRFKIAPYHRHTDVPVSSSAARFVIASALFVAVAAALILALAIWQAVMLPDATVWPLFVTGLAAAAEAAWLGFSGECALTDARH